MNHRPCIVDMDGTIYRGDQPLPYAVELTKRWAALGVAYLFMTNNPERSPVDLSKKLAAMGIASSPNDIITSAGIAADYLYKQGASSAFVLGSPYLKQLVLDRGIRLDAEKPEYVLVGHNREFGYADLALAANLIAAGSDFVCTDLDHAIPSGEKMLPHTGAIAAYLLTATGKAPKNIGKPERYFLDIACNRLSCRPEELLVIGDNLHTDIEMGRRCGAETALVLTGMTDAETAKRADDQPTYVVEGLGELMQLVFSD